MKQRILTGSFAAFVSNGCFFAADTATASGGENSTEAPPVLSPADFLEAHPIVEKTIIELKKLVVDAGTQPRVAIDDDIVKQYTEVVKESVKNEQPNPFDSLPTESLPQVFRDATGRCVLADGFHRYASHKGAHVKEMTVAIRNGDERDALRFSLGTNATHGVQRTQKDKRRAVMHFLNDPQWTTMSNMDIARGANVSEFLVRELRPAAKSPSKRVVTLVGKKVTMDTSAIGKGKGGGKKAVKAKAKAAKKAGKTAPAAAPVDDKADLDKQLMKIAQAVSGTEGGKIRAAVLDGSLALSAREVRDWSNLGDKYIKGVAPLVTGGARMKPTKAFDFLTSQLSEKIVTELHNRALGAGGKFEYEADGVKIVVTHIGEKK